MKVPIQLWVSGAGVVGAVPPVWLLFGRVAGCAAWLLCAGLFVVVGAAAVPSDDGKAADEVR